MSSYDIRAAARQLLKNLPGKYSLFAVPILLSFVSAGLQAYIRERTTMAIESGQISQAFSFSPFPLMIDVLLVLFTLAACYTVLEAYRGQRQSVSSSNLTRTFKGRYLLHLFLLYLVKNLLLLPWAILMIIPLIIGLIAVGASGSTGTFAVFGLLSLVGLIGLIIKTFAYSQAELVLFDRIETSQDLDPFDIIKESKTLMTGKKFDLFILQLSFLGWYVLSMFTFGLLLIYILPYNLTATVIFYDQLRAPQD